MTIIDDYLELADKYTLEYGEDTLLLIQVGHFFECYAIDNEKEKINTHAFYKSADIMNIQVTRKSKKITENSRGNPLMTGVNIYTRDKYIQILLDANFTVVLMEQVTEPPDPKREVTQIYSPGTSIEYSNKNSTTNTMCIYIEPDKTDPKRRFKNIGLSVVDFTTGKNCVYEVYSLKNTGDYYYSLDETLRFVNVYEPCEVLLIVEDSEENCGNIREISKGFLVNYLNLGNTRVHFKTIDSINTEYSSIAFQNAFFEKIFKRENDTMLSILEYLDIELLSIARMSYIHLLNFAYAHNENIIQKIKCPEVFESMNYMILNNNSIQQLNVTPTGNTIVRANNSLLGILTNTSTSIGKRYLRDQLLNPICDPQKIEKRYEYTDILIKNENYREVEPLLNKIIDIERLHRRFSLGIIQPSEIYSLNYSYESIAKITTEKSQYFHRDLIPSEESLEQFKKFRSEYTRVFRLETLAKFNIETITENIFNPGISAEIDAIETKIKSSYDNLGFICKQFTKSIGNDIDVWFKIENNERDGYFITSTPNRANSLSKKLVNYGKGVYTVKTALESFTINAKDITFKRQAANKTIVSCPEIVKLCSDYQRGIIEIGRKCQKLFREYTDKFEMEYSGVMNTISKFVGTLDIYKSSAKTAVQNGYHRPTIVTDTSNSSSSFIRARAIRHPIIERLEQSTIYVPNDIEIGSTNDINQTGMLLYGTNASGKSSLMKAVGLNIIMAQAGFYVAAEEFHYRPYQRLFTRILNADNIFRGESSFAVEMGELRGILKRANGNSLVLGDELCSGTENTSAQSIFASSVIHLSKRNTSFIFATHLHQLVKMPEIQALDRVKAYHLSVEYDQKRELLVYDRVLKHGNGPTIYGLEVCKAMDLDAEFIATADTIRRSILDIGEVVLDNKTSRYNTKVIVDKCEICDEKAEDTHHIQFQCSADKDGIIGKQFHKNTLSNLVPLCKKCHNSVHANKIVIKGYKETSAGVELEYSLVSETEKQCADKTRKKFTDEQVDTIKSVSLQVKWKNQKLLQEYLEKEYEIVVSSGILRKIRAGSY